MKKFNLKTKLLFVCERRDIAHFVQIFAQYWRKQGVQLPQFDTVYAEGWQQLDRLALELFKSYQGYFDKIILLGDATSKPRQRLQEAYQMLSKSLKPLALAGNGDYFLLPGKRPTGHWQPGYLEDALLTSLKPIHEDVLHHQAMLNAAGEYLLTINHALKRPKPSHISSRSRLCVFFAGMEEYAGLMLGEVLMRGAFDLEHECWNGVKELLLGLGEKDT